MSLSDQTDPRSLFHPLIQQLFAEKVGTPTDIQARDWPEIARGRHVLVTAPTGSGKTLTAFLWVIHQLVTGAWAPGRTRVLYVSPLKALNNDMRRNLATPLKTFGFTGGDKGLELVKRYG
jgi:ATP-dependent helicase Lhr and Lhr-like helicase